MTSVCPAGHDSTADDYCDVCGMPIDATSVTPGAGAASAPVPPAPPADSTGQVCPNCDTENVAEALFCESCGYDFTTGSMPRPETDPDQPAATSVASASPAFSWVAELWIDPAWYEAQDSPDELPSPGLPDVIPLPRTSLLVGRTSRSRNITPDIDCGSDSGVSRRQAQLTSDGRRWFVEDLESANGTFIGSATNALPEDPIPVGVKRELDADDRIYLGAWTRLVIREATEDEVAEF
ncbi:MAG: FHA domain-containing protein [Microlunatus sp.]|nr:FHA domain-containing protein [Microlunatus sp.]